MLDTLPATRLEAEEHPPTSGGCGAWSVAQTNPQAERWAAQNLHRIGYATYLPLIRVRRRDPVHRTISRLVDVPLWPGYLFVVAGTHWAPIVHTAGVHRLLMACGRPSVVRSGLVEALRASESDRRCEAGTPDRWLPGAACAVVAGPFTGHHAVVTASAGNSARVALMVFGAMREIDIPTDWLEAS